MGHADLASGLLFDKPKTHEELSPAGPEIQRQQAMSKTPAERAEYARTVPVNVDSYLRALEFIENLIMRAKRTKQPGGLWLMGEGGVGKSFILNTVYRRHSPQETPLMRQTPVLLLNLESRPSESDILTSLYLQLGQDPNLLRYQRNSDIKESLLEALPACGSLAVLFDESHHLWIKQRYSSKYEIGGKLGDFLKRFVDDSGLAYVFSGSKQLEKVRSADPQAKTRWIGVETLNDFEFDEKFIGLLAALDEALPMPEKAGLASNPLARLIFDTTLGNFRVLKNFLSEAVYLAASDDSPHITKQHLARAHFLTFCSAPNPFN